jgi:hypothetical protein
MSKRFEQANFIAQGACNPTAIALSIHEAGKECIREGMGTAQICADPAIRLMLHQLDYICKMYELEDFETLTRVFDECKARAAS